MASPSVTYSFVNGQTSDGPAVSQNFSDIISALTDGTKTITVAALATGTLSITSGLGLPIGSNSAPALFYSTETTLGWYRLATGSVAFSGSSSTNVIYSILNIGSGGNSLQLGGFTGSTGDQYCYFYKTGASSSDWSLGRDDTDGFFKISESSVLGTNDALKISNSTLAVTLRGTTTNDSAAAGYVGEVITANSSGVSVAATDTFANIASISLTAGDWDVEATFSLSSGLTGLTRVQAAISTTTTATDSVSNGGIAIKVYASFSPAASMYDDVGIRRISISSPTTVYFVGRATFSGGSATWQTDSYMIARRVR